MTEHEIDTKQILASGEPGFSTSSNWQNGLRITAWKAHIRRTR
jgi:hypothetical protein